MAEKQNLTPEAVEADVVVEETKQSALKNFTEKHPRATKVVGITAGVAAVAGVAYAVKNSKAGSESTDPTDFDGPETFALSGAESTADSDV